MKPFALLLAAAMTAACSSNPPLEPSALAELAEQRMTTAGSGSLTLTVTGVEGTEGVLGVSLYLSKDGFPGDYEDAYVARRVPAANGAELVFEKVPAGEFAFSVYHDIDDDGELDTGLLGIPSEPWGVSRGARGSFGPPKYKNAKLDLAAGQSLAVEVEVEE